jgi:hypothetical protein
MQCKLDDEEVSENARSLRNKLTMIVTEHFVHVHTARTAVTFLNGLILVNFPEDRRGNMIMLGSRATRRLAQKNGQHARLFDPVSMV